ncbi:MAG: phosphopantetheine-binding protein [Mariprofundaceae bacterium]|nr:phosphopantetheine-binding protein [Mariprofundaceae bacterium]
MSDESKVLIELGELVLSVVPSAVLSSEEDYDRPMGEIGIDSLDTMSVLLEAQEKFGVEVPDEVVDKLVSLRSIAAYIARQQG